MKATKRSKDGTAMDTVALEKERKELYISGKNTKRLKEINAVLDFFHWGIK